jgi:hypothetical protein
MNEENVVYKFRSFNNGFHRKIIIDNELWFPTPLMLNDPFEIINSVDFRIYLKSGIGIDKNYFIEKCKYYFIDNIDIVKDVVNQIICVYFGNTESIKNAIIKAEQFLQEGIKVNENPEYKEIMTKLINVVSYYYAYERKRCHLKYCGLVSFSKSIDNILLWSHYADSHQGFAVGFYEDKIKEFVAQSYIQRENIHLFYAKDVDYFDVYKSDGACLEFLPLVYSDVFFSLMDIIPFLNNMPDAVLHSFILYAFHTIEAFNKAPDWKYEKEYRLISNVRNGSMKYDKSWIKEVVLGVDYMQNKKEDLKYVKEIINYCKNNNIPLFEMRTDNLYSYSLTKEKLVEFI